MPQILEAVGRSQPFVKVQPPVIVAQRAPASTDTDYPKGQGWLDESASPAALYTHIGGGTWDQGGNAIATNTVYGIVRIDTDGTLASADDTHVPTALATKTYADSLAIAGAPVATEAVAGIGELATDAEAVAGTASTPTVALFVTPSNLSAVFAAPPAIGGTTAAAGTFTGLTADGTGAVSLGSNAAADFTVATGDLSLIATLSSVVITAGEAAADAIDINAASGGLDIDVALLASITSTRNNAQAILLESTAGGIDILASGSGGAGEDIDIICTGGSVNLSGTENAADAVTIAAANGGIQITCGGAAGEDIVLTNTAGSIHLTAGEGATDAINIDSSGGVDVDASGAINIASSNNGASAVVITASAGGVDITATGASAGEDINITATGSSVNVTSTENAAQAIYIRSNGGTSETLDIHCDQGTGVASINVHSDVGGVTVASGLASADAINITASDAAGGIDIDAGTAGVIVDTTGAISLDAAAASNFTATGAFDITLNSTAGSMIMTGGEAAVDAIDINASNVAGGIDIDAGTGGITIDSTGAISIDAAAASNFSCSAGDMTIDSAAGSLILSSGEDVADSIQILADAGGIDITCAAGAAGQDIDITNTGGSINITATESDSAAIVINASGAAGAVQILSGTGGVVFDSGMVVNVTAKANADTPYTVLGSDYLIAADVSAGVLTVTLPAAPATGRVVLVMDVSGNAGANNITIGGNGKNISAAGTAAGSKLIDSAYGGMYLIYTGTIWSAWDLP